MFIRKSIASLAVVAASVAVGSPAGADAGGTSEGCTPGFWKNHTSHWLETPTEAIDPSTTLKDVFYSVPHPLRDATMLEALSFKGGNDLEGALSILYRHATAAYLNAANEGLEYPIRRWSEGENGEDPLLRSVRVATESGDRDAILALAESLDAANNLGCPLGGQNTNSGGGKKNK